jgi:hypothetical protein
MGRRTKSIRVRLLDRKPTSSKFRREEDNAEVKSSAMVIHLYWILKKYTEGNLAESTTLSYSEGLHLVLTMRRFPHSYTIF